MKVEILRDHIKAMLSDTTLTENDLLKIRETIVKRCVRHLEKQFPGAEILTLDQFSEGCTDGIYSPYDGNGYFWDGAEKTHLSVWDESWAPADMKTFYFVIWYDEIKGDSL